MDKGKKISLFIQYFLLLSPTRIGDGISTYIATPDLEYEQNPLVTVLGFGWIGLILIGVLVVILFMMINYYYVFFCYKIQQNIQFDSIKEYVSYYHFNDKNSFWKIFYKNPNYQVTLSILGYLLPNVFIFYSVLLIISNFLVFTSDTYGYYLVVYKLWVLLYLVLIPIIIYYYVSFFQKSFKEYQAKQKENLTSLQQV